MTDATRRPGDVPPVEGHHAAPGARSDVPDPGTRGSGTREEADRTAPAANGESPLVAAHPQPGDTTPAGAGTRHDGDRMTGTGAYDDGDRMTGTGTHHDGDRTSVARLLRLDDADKLAVRLQHAVAGFVDAPRDAVREADHVLQELTARFTDAVTERRRTLRRSWQTDSTGEGEAEAATDTEQLRLALRDYRELAERLLHA